MHLRTNHKIIGIGGGGRVGGRISRTETISKRGRTTRGSRTIRTSLTNSRGGKANLTRRMSRLIHQWFNQSSRLMKMQS